VKTGGDWDYKQSIFSFSRSRYYRYNGQIVPFDAPGNINYGYTGSAMGFSLSLLQAGAGFAQIQAGTAHSYDFRSYFDDPFDQSFVGLGANRYLRERGSH
jgi:hypothetical protein